MNQWLAGLCRQHASRLAIVAWRHRQGARRDRHTRRAVIAERLEHDTDAVVAQQGVVQRLELRVEALALGEAGFARRRGKQS